MNQFSDPLIFSVIGTGALGGYYGGLLAKQNYRVQFLARSDANYLQTNGLTVHSPQGNFSLPHIEVFNNSQLMTPADVILICLKSTQNKILAQILPPLLKPNTVIVCLQNGLGIEEDLFTQFPNHSIIGGLCFLCAHKTQPGLVSHLDYGAIRLAPHLLGSQAPTPQLEKIKSLFIQAGIPTSLASSLKLARWQKLVWNIPFNGLSVLLGTTTDQLLAHPQTLSLVRRLMDEVQSLARFDGATIEDSFLEKMLTDTARMVPYKTSMYLDYLASRPLELHYMFTVPLDRGGPQNAPSISMLLQSLHFLTRDFHS